MGEDIVISARNVSKHFISHTERATSLKERLISRRSSQTMFHALNNINLDIEKGSTVGLIGANGSGKSTTLKVLAGILRPTTGEVSSRGRIASLLELGAGFNSELTGRENVYLNASLLGLTRRETDGLFDQILDFSELAEFIDAPVKHYSSGMYVRLGFSVAVHVDPDILLVDEVLAVGDEHFSRKCLAKIAEFQDQGRTILFVSHGLDLIERICSRAVVLDHGNVKYDGDPYFATGELRKILGTDLPEEIQDETPEGSLIDFGAVTFSHQPGSEAIAEFKPGQPLSIRAELSITDYWAAKVDKIQAVVMVVGRMPVWAMALDRDQLPNGGGHWALDFVVPSCPRTGGRFVVSFLLLAGNGTPMAMHQTQHAFAVEPEPGHSVGLLSVDYQTASSQIVPA